jgi:pimeloyl-ACP methyl ester carboxylesterase
MDESALTRRRLLQLAAAGLGSAGLTACTGSTAPTSPGATTAAASLPAPIRPAAPLTVTSRTGSFISAFRPGVVSNWSLAAPEVPPGGRHPQLPVAIFLHGLGGSHSALLEEMAAQETLQRHLDAGGASFGVAAVDGGNTWWHSRADGSDTQSMLVKEFVPLLGNQGFDLGRVGLFGFSMGGFGSLLLASQGKLPGLRAVAAMSPAVWDRYDERLEGAFDGPADFAANDVFALRPRLAAVPKRIDCGTQDELLATIREYARELPGEVEGGFQPGGHDSAYLHSILPEVLSFLGRHLG